MNCTLSFVVFKLITFMILYLSTALSAGSINKHLMNGILVLISLIITAKPLRILHMYQPVLFSVFYVIFTAIYYSAGGGTIYNILDWGSVGGALGLSLPLALIATPIVHLFCFSLFQARSHVAKKMECTYDYNQKVEPDKVEPDQQKPSVSTLPAV